MTADTMREIADILKIEPFAVLKGMETSGLTEQVYSEYMGVLTLMGNFYLNSDARKYAAQMAISEPRWKIIVVDSRGKVTLLKPQRWIEMAQELDR
jgi:hypothetical protein